MTVEIEIQKVYIAYFNRPADSAGLEYWSQAIASGSNTIQDLTDAFSTSAEYLSVYGGASNETVISEVYQNLFGRQPEPDGLAYWLGEMNAGRVSIGNIAYAALNGAGGSDLETITNKAKAAVEFTNFLEARNADEQYSADVLQDVKSWMSTIDGSNASYLAAVQEISDRYDFLQGPLVEPKVYTVNVLNDLQFEGVWGTRDLPSFRYGVDKIDLVGYTPQKLVYHEGDMSLVKGDFNEVIFWVVHETKKSAYSTGFVQDNDLKAGEALMVQFVWNGVLQTYVHLDQDETDDEGTIEAGYEAGEAVWNFPDDRLLNLTGITGMPDFTNGQSIDGLFI